jgi:hypothetical protein
MEVTRNIVVKDLTKEQFVNAMAEDMLAFKALHYETMADYNEMKWNEAVERKRGELTDMLNAKYKREDTKKRHFDRLMNEWLNVNKWFYKTYEIRSLSWDLHPESQSGSNYFDLDERLYTQLGTFYDNNMGNKYLNECIGWKIRKERCVYQVVMILPENVQKEWNDAESALCRSITEFYKDTTYFGD